MRNPVFCIYCGISSAKTTIGRDHVPPKCLLGDPLPPNCITVPACNKCNSSFGFNDEYFKEKILLNANNTHQNRDEYGSSVVRGLRRPQAIGNFNRFLSETRESCILNQFGYPFVRLTHDENRLDHFIVRCVKAIAFKFSEEILNRPLDFKTMVSFQIDILDRFASLDFKDQKPVFSIDDKFSAWFYAAKDSPFVLINLRFFNFDFVSKITESLVTQRKEDEKDDL